MTIDASRRYRWTAMTGERLRAIAKYRQHPERIGEEGLAKLKRALDRAQAAHAAFVNDPTAGRAANNKAKRKLASTLFYARVDYDAYRMVLADIEPNRQSVFRASREHTLTPAQRSAMHTHRYRMRNAKQTILHLTYELECARALRATARANTDQHAATTRLLRSEYEHALAEARVQRGQHARAPAGMRARMRASVDAWKAAYREWQKHDAEVKRIRILLTRAEATREYHSNALRQGDD